MNKLLDSYLNSYSSQIYLLDLSQILNSFNLEGVKCSLKISTSSDLLQGSYTCRK
jgi:hypothetical protein